ncbi:HlyD family efflux transporter periplasmic adaptor subunit [bacterium]|nr:HlyD family efflux transporter periplasmic adaptor subunit [bacterium]
MLKWLRNLLFLAVLAGGGYWLWLQYGAQPLPGWGTQTIPVDQQTLSQTASVARGDLKAVLSMVGELKTPQSEDLAFDRLKGTVSLQTLLVEPGSTVEAGAPLATIDPAPFEQALALARTRLAEAEARLAELKTPITTLQRSESLLAIAEAEMAQRKAEDALNKLTTPNPGTQQTNMASARRELASAQARLADLEARQSRDTNVNRLWDVESQRGAEFTRLSNEVYSDAYYEDRLRLAYNSMMDAGDERKTKQIQQEIELLEAQVNVRNAQRSLTAAQNTAANTPTGPNELRLAQARHAIVHAEANVVLARENYTKLEAGPETTKLANAEAAVADAQQVVANTEADLAATVLVAPFAGTVLSVASSQGSRITSSSAILRLANLSQLQVVAGVDETMIRQVQKGQRVSLTFDALPGQQFSGEVLSVPLQGRLQGDVMVYSVPISISGVDELNLKVGMTANVEIAVGEVTGALLVPKMAVQQRASGYVVLTPNPDPAGAPLEIPVDVGLSDGLFTEIRRGLNEGDSIIVPLDKGEEEFQFGMMGY